MEDPKETPEEMASNFKCAMFNSSQAVLQGARHMVCLLDFLFGHICEFNSFALWFVIIWSFSDFLQIIVDYFRLLSK